MAALGWLQNLAIGGSPVSAVVPTPTPSAGGRSKKRRRRYVVEVDKQYFEVNSIAEAESVLAQVRELAEESAERDVVTEATPKPPRVTVKTATGKTTTSKVLAREVKRTQKVVNKAYSRAAQLFKQRLDIDKEIGQLLRAKIHREDEDATIIALLM
jgi:hypothetical protein